MEPVAAPPVVDAMAVPPAESYGVFHFWEQSDAIIHAVAIVLLIMSVLSWTQIVFKGIAAARSRKTSRSLEKFWQAATVEEAVAGISRNNQHSSYVDLARQALSVAGHFDSQGKTIGASMDSSEFLTRALRQSIIRSTARLESGLTLLASIGSVAPFVGLFGTVWGIYHALLSIAAAGSASIDKVSGPVGEALVMTAAGLFVAIPAVLAYNAFTRFNRMELADFDGFAHDLHAYFSTGGRIGARAQIHVVEKRVP